MVVKIQKPDVRKHLTQDLEILDLLAGTLDRAIPGLGRVVKEYLAALE